MKKIVLIVLAVIVVLAVSAIVATEEMALGLEKKVEEALAGAKGKVDKEKMKIMTAMFKEAQSNLHIVEYGGGTHNKKYAMSLIDVATTGFENVMDSLDEQ